jgi:hypothetical protein
VSFLSEPFVFDNNKNKKTAKTRVCVYGRKGTIFFNEFLTLVTFIFSLSVFLLFVGLLLELYIPVNEAKGRY